MLTLELTETTLMRDVQPTLARLELLKAIGVRLAIDDFGTGYSSLAYLRQFPIDVLKIDKSFVSGIADSSDSAAIVHTLVQLGKVLGLEIIAEGVENDEQRMRLKAEKIDIAQGILFARPLDVEALNRFSGAASVQARLCVSVTVGQLPRARRALPARPTRLSRPCPRSHDPAASPVARSSAGETRHPVVSRLVPFGPEPR